MHLSIAAQACSHILNLSPALYEGWDQIIVYPEGFIIQCELEDEDSVLHNVQEEVIGEAWESRTGHSSFLAADLPSHHRAACNVIICEFAHKLDQQSGLANGMPGLGAHPKLNASTCHQVPNDSLDSFANAVATVKKATLRKP